MVVHYASDLPMIPLVLTSVTSAPLLDVTAYLLGPGRAIPRNYHHVVLDDAALDWDSTSYSPRALPNNYMEQVRAATLQAPGHHAFVTERAEELSNFAPALFSAGRFGDLDDLRKITSAPNYLAYLRSYGYTFTSVLVAVLAKHIKMPPDLHDRAGTRATPANYFYNFDFWHERYPEQFVGVDLGYDPVALTNEIEEKVVKPVRKAAALFDAASRPGITLTRLFTRLAPADMNSDPVFSFNPSLGPEDGLHSAILQHHCDLQPHTYVKRLTTEEGFVIDYRNRPRGLPAALRIEILREAGLPEVLVDNRQKIIDLIGSLPALPELPAVTTDPRAGGSVTGYGCAVAATGGTGQSGGWRTVAAALAALALVASFTRARRRARRIRRG